MRNDTLKRHLLGSHRSWPFLTCIMALYVLVVLTYACGESEQTAISASTQNLQTSSTAVAAASHTTGPDNKSQQASSPASSQRDSVAPTASEAVPASSAPVVAGQAPAAANSVPASPYGPPSLDEIIFYTDVIAIVRPISSEAGVLTGQDPQGRTTYNPVVQTRYEVVEYLKGDGDFEIIVNANNFTTAWVSAEQALENAERDLAAQDSKLDGGEGIVFIRSTRYPDEVSDISRKEDGTEWRQYNAQAGLFSAAKASGLSPHQAQYLSQKPLSMRVILSPICASV